MGLFSSVGRGLAAISTGGLSEVYRSGAKQNEAQSAAQNSEQQRLAQERKGLLEEGLAAGRDKAQLLTGQTQEQVGQDVSDIVNRRRDMLDSPSRAESFIRSQGQHQERMARSAGGSEAQQRQIAMESAQRAGMQGDVDRERRLQDFQSLMDGIMKTQSSLEPAYGQMYVGSQYIPAATEEAGIMGNMSSGVTGTVSKLLGGLLG